MRYWLGPYVGDGARLESAYRPPDGVVGHVDLRSEVCDVAFLTTPDDVALGDGYELLGQGHLADVRPSKATWGALVGVTPESGDLLGMLWETLSVKATKPPLMPTARGDLELHLGGHSLVRRKRFRLDLPEAAPIIRVLQAQYRRHREDAQAGRIVSRGEVDPEHHRRLLDVWGRKYRVRHPEDVFIPRGLPRETRLRHQTTVADDFNRTNESPLSGAWTGVVSTHKVDTNVCIGNANPAISRYDSDLSTDDHYAQVAATTGGAPSVGACARFDSSAETFYLVWGESTSVLRAYKALSASYSQVGSNGSYTFSAPDTFRIEADGSNVTGKVNGATIVGPATDTDITGYTRTGIRTYFANVDDFEGGDLAAAAASAVPYRYRRAMNALLAM